MRWSVGGEGFDYMSDGGLGVQGGVEKHRVRAEALVSQGQFRTGTHGLWMSLSYLLHNLATL